MVAGEATGTAEAEGAGRPAGVSVHTALGRHAHRVAAGASLTDPDTYKKEAGYAVNQEIEDIYRRWDQMVKPAQRPSLERIVHQLAKAHRRHPARVLSVPSMPDSDYRLHPSPGG